MHPRLSIDQLCFPGLDAPAFLRECRDLGADAVVLTSPGLLAPGGRDAARRAVADHGIDVVALNHPFAVAPDLASDTRAVTTLVDLLGVASELGAGMVYLLTGGRGPLGWEAAAARFAALVGEALPVARELGVSVLLENASALYADIHIAHSLADALVLAERAGIGLCIDLQFCWADAGLADLLRRAVPRTGLVQVSDYVLGDRLVPGRAVPGDGVIPLHVIVRDLLGAGYDGRFDIELLGPRIDAEGHRSAVERAVARLERILADVEAERGGR